MTNSKQICITQVSVIVQSYWKKRDRYLGIINYVNNNNNGNKNITIKVGILVYTINIKPKKLINKAKAIKK